VFPKSSAAQQDYSTGHLVGTMLVDNTENAYFWSFVFTRAAATKVAVTTVLLLFYIGSYYCLSRRGMDEAERYHGAGFLYISMENALTNKSLFWHHVLRYLYMPVNCIDRTCFRGQAPTIDMLFHLSGQRKDRDKIPHRNRIEEAEVKNRDSDR